MVSLSRDLLLVPAELHSSNSSVRPRMTLLLPAPDHVTGDSTDPQRDVVAMMQIDCEVIHTSLLQVAGAAAESPVHTSQHQGAREKNSKIEGDKIRRLNSLDAPIKSVKRQQHHSKFDRIFAKKLDKFDSHYDREFYEGSNSTDSSTAVEADVTGAGAEVYENTSFSALHLAPSLRERLMAAPVP